MSTILNEIIYFWSARDEYGFLSQWFVSQFTDEAGITYNCAEQYMMYQKAILFKDKEIAQKILAETSPKIIKAFGRHVANFDPAVWDKSKFDIVRTGNYLKFTQNKELKQKLLETKDAVLAEASPYDCVWGIGLSAADAASYPNSAWRGENLLGKALMAVREDLVEEMP